MTLKGQVTFLKLCLKVVLMATIIPRFTLILLATVLRSKNAFISLCSRQHSLLALTCWREHNYRDDGFWTYIIPKRQNRFIVAVSRQASHSPIVCTYYNTSMLLCSDFTSLLLRNRDATSSTRVSMLTRADYGYDVCSVLNPKRELDFKIAVTAGLQDIISM